jgi:hypothetical protein
LAATAGAPNFAVACVILTGWIISTGGPRVALLVGSGACLAAAALAAFVHTPPNPDQTLTDLAS